MPSKTTKKARRAADKHAIKGPVLKDDGTRWAVVRNAQPVYVTNGGVLKGEAERLAAGLLEPAEIVQINQS